jgi:hypothetical protein
MENYKLINMLSSLDKKEFKRLGEFTASPYFNKNKNVISIYKVLSKYYPGFSNKKLNIENLFRMIFPKEKYDYSKIKNIMSDLYQVTQKFLTISNFESSEPEKGLNLLDELLIKKQFNEYQKKFKSLNGDIENTKSKDEEYYYLKYKLSGKQRQYLFETAPNTNLDIVQEEFDNFLNFTLIRLLRFYNLMEHEMFQNNLGYEQRMMDEVLSYLEKNAVTEIPVLSIYKNIFYLQRTRDKKYYNELKKLKALYRDELTFRDKHLLNIHLFDFIAHQVMKIGDYSYFKEAFEHYKGALSDGIYTKDNLTYLDFMNIVKTACSAKDFQWAKGFINDYKSCIPPDETDDTINFSYGTIEQMQGNLQNALAYFSKTNFSNFIMKEQVKVLQCRLCYELGLFDQAYSVIDSFRHFLQREKLITDSHKEIYFPFLKLLSKVIKIKECDDMEDRGFELEKLIEEINNLSSNPFGVRRWLLEQAKKLKN